MEKLGTVNGPEEGLESEPLAKAWGSISGPGNRGQNNDSKN